jgi:N-acetylmuramoyl-L-alanine amidase
MKKNKRLLLLTAVLFLLAVMVITAMTYVDKTAQSTSAVGYIQNDITVILDAGHGGEDGGAVANGITEKDINLSITNKLAEVLRLNGFRVILTRNTDKMINTEGDTLRARKLSDMKNRLNLFNSSEKNVVISIHQNKFPVEKYQGAQVFYSINNPNSRKLALSLRENIRTLIQPYNEREIKPAGREIYLLDNAETPAVIIECGFLSNPKEAEKLSNSDYQDKLVFAFMSGFLDFYNNEV